MTFTPILMPLKDLTYGKPKATFRMAAESLHLSLTWAAVGPVLFWCSLQPQPSSNSGHEANVIMSLVPRGGIHLPSPQNCHAGTREFGCWTWL